MADTMKILKNMGGYIKSSRCPLAGSGGGGGGKSGSSLSDFEKVSRKNQMDYYTSNKRFVKRFERYANLMESNLKKKDVGLKMAKKGSGLDWVFLLVGGLMILGGFISKKIGGFVDTIKNIVKIFSNVINALKGFGLLKVLGGPVMKVFGSLGKVFQPFMKVVTTVMKFTKVGRGLLGIGKVFGKFLGKFMKKIPILGGLISIGEAIFRFMKGDIVGGIIDLAAGITGFIPGVGSIISIALSLINMARDNPQVVKKIGEKAIQIGGVVVDFVKKYLWFIPPFYTFIKVGDAVEKFKNKDIKGGIIDIAMGVGGLIPGLSMVLGLMEGRGKEIKESKVGKFIFNLAGVVVDFVKKYLWFIPPFYTFIKVGDAIEKFKNKDIKGGIIDIVTGIGGLIPGLSLTLGLMEGRGKEIKKNKVGKFILNLAVVVIDFVKKYLWFIPPFYTFIKIGDAIEKFKKGDIKGGIIDIAMGIGGMMPGTGGVFGIISGLLEGRWKAFKKPAKKLLNLIGVVIDFIKKHLWFLPPFYTFFKIGDAIGKFKSGDLRGGLIDVALGIAGIIPGLGPILEGIIGFLGGKKQKGGKVNEKSESIFEKIKNDIKEKINAIIFAPIEALKNIISKNTKFDEENNKKVVDIFGIIKDVTSAIFEKIKSIFSFINFGDIDEFIKTKIAQIKVFLFEGGYISSEVDKMMEKFESGKIELGTKMYKEKAEQIESLNKKIEELREKKDEASKKEYEQAILEREKLLKVLDVVSDKLVELERKEKGAKKNNYTLAIDTLRIDRGPY